MHRRIGDVRPYDKPVYARNWTLYIWSIPSITLGQCYEKQNRKGWFCLLLVRYFRKRVATWLIGGAF